MKSLFSFITSFVAVSFSFSQLPTTQIECKQHTLNLETRIDEGYAHAHIAKWKKNYLISYIDLNEESHIFSTADFKKLNKICSFKQEYIWDIETAGNQIAVLYSPINKVKNQQNYREVYVKLLNDKGEIIKKTKLLGDSDMNKPLAYCIDNIGSRYLRWERNQYVAFFAISHNFAEKAGQKPDIHQGQTEIYIDSNLTVLSKEINWGVSHSFEQRIDVSENFTLKVAKGDAYPRGIHFSVQSHVLEQDEDDLDFYPEFYSSGVPMLISGAIGDNYVDLVLGDVYINEKAKEVNIIGATRDKRKSADIFYITQNFENKTAKPETIWLTNTASVEEHSVRMFPYKDNNYLVLWKEYTFSMKASENEKYNDLLDSDIDKNLEVYREIDRKQQVKAAIINKKGEFISKPTEVDLNLNIIVKDVAASNDQLHDLLENFSIYLADFLVEENRILLYFYYPRDTKMELFEINKN
jgi:hypothetical protein